MAVRGGDGRALLAPVPLSESPSESLAGPPSASLSEAAADDGEEEGGRARLGEEGHVEGVLAAGTYVYTYYNIYIYIYYKGRALYYYTGMAC